MMLPAHHDPIYEDWVSCAMDQAAAAADLTVPACVADLGALVCWLRRLEVDLNMMAAGLWGPMRAAGVDTCRSAVCYQSARLGVWMGRAATRATLVACAALPEALQQRHDVPGMLATVRRLEQMRRTDGEFLRRLLGLLVDLGHFER